MHFRSAKNMDTCNVDYKIQILSAIDDLDLQKASNYVTTAKKFDLVRTTLKQKHTSQFVSRSETTTKFW